MPSPGADRARIGLLQCGHIVVRDRHGDYPELFADLLAGHGIDLVTLDVTAGPPPSAPGSCDGWIVSGSASSAYDPLPWIPPLETFLRRVVDAEVPLVGVCFGHQVLAQALGGRVERSPLGWGVGGHEYALEAGAPWCDPPAPGGRVRLVASHQDQVTVLPDGARPWLRSDHCEVAGYTVGARALALQPHPEFPAALSAELIGLRRDAIGPERADTALAGLDAPLDQSLVGAWIARFLRAAR